MCIVNLILGGPKRSEIAGIEVDATITERHSHRAQATRFPVEVGAEITDHVHQLPDSISIDGIISDTPIGVIDGIAAEPERAQARYNELLRAKEDGETVDVVTALRSYENMVFEALEVRRDSNTGKAIGFTATLTEVRFAVAERVAFTPQTAAAPRAAASKNAGPAATTPATDAGESLLSKMVPTSLLP